MLYLPSSYEAVFTAVHRAAIAHVEQETAQLVEMVRSRQEWWGDACAEAVRFAVFTS